MEDSNEDIVYQLFHEEEPDPSPGVQGEVGAPPLGVPKVVRADVETYLGMLKFQDERPDLCAAISRGRWCGLLRNRDLSIPVPDEIKWNISYDTTLVSASGDHVDLLFHRCLARAHLEIRASKWRAIYEDARNRGVAVHPGWQPVGTSDDLYLVSCWLLYLVPDVAWGASAGLNSPTDGGPIVGDRHRVRDRDFGTNPLSLIYPFDDLLVLDPTHSWDSLEQLKVDRVSFDIERVLKTLPISYGFAGGINADCIHRIGGTIDGFHNDASILRSGLKWDSTLRNPRVSDPVFPNDYLFDSAEASKKATVHYDSAAWNLTCLQRIFSVQASIPMGPCFKRITSTSWAVPKSGRRRRQTIKGALRRK